MDPYREKGIEWIYKLVEKDSECKATLYDHTLFYLEEYIGSFVARHRMEFRMDVKLAQKRYERYAATRSGNAIFRVLERERLWKRGK